MEQKERAEMREFTDFNGAKMALLKGDQLVSILRDDKADIPFPNMWDFPGGGREQGESPEACVLRELHEELGLVLPEAALSYKRRYATGRQGEVVSWFFVAAAAGGGRAGLADVGCDAVFADEQRGAQYESAAGGVSGATRRGLKTVAAVLCRSGEMKDHFRAALREGLPLPIAKDVCDFQLGLHRQGLDFMEVCKAQRAF